MIGPATRGRERTIRDALDARPTLRETFDPETGVRRFWNGPMEIDEETFRRLANEGGRRAAADVRRLGGVEVVKLLLIAREEERREEATARARVGEAQMRYSGRVRPRREAARIEARIATRTHPCLLYTADAADDLTR